MKKYRITIKNLNTTFLVDENTNLGEALRMQGINLVEPCDDCKANDPSFCGKGKCDVIIDDNLISANKVEVDQDITLSLVTLPYKFMGLDSRRYSTLNKFETYRSRLEYRDAVAVVDLGTSNITISLVITSDKIILDENGGILKDEDTYLKLVGKNAIDDMEDIESEPGKPYEISYVYPRERFDGVRDWSVIESSSVPEEARVLKSTRFVFASDDRFKKQAIKSKTYNNYYVNFRPYVYGYRSKSITFVNPQVIYGKDVISRISYSLKGEGASKLQQLVIRRLAEQIEKASKRRKCRLKYIVLSGNTTMITMFLGKSCSSITKAPFDTSLLRVPPVTTKEIGMEIKTGKKAMICDVDGKILRKATPGTLLNIPIYFIPAISAFVGGDFVSGLSTIDPPREDKYKVFIDLGTNTEMAIIGSKKTITTSAPAGPCFEGANISSGMPATEGAIYMVDVDKNGMNSIMFYDKKVTEDSKPLGICGTGLIDTISALKKIGAIDNRGTLVTGKPYKIFGDIEINQNDIREFQKAKAAIRAGLDLLIKEIGASYDDIEEIIFTGGFASKLREQSLIQSGLIPERLKNKTTSLPNHSLLGAAKTVVEGFNRVFYISENAKYINMAAHPSFEKLYISYLDF